MFDRFGEIEQVEDFNILAGNLRTEGDREGLLTLAKENGIDREIADAFLEGEIDILADAATYAIGKVTMEAEKLKPVEIMEDWVEYLKSQCNDDEQMAAGVRSSKKSLEGCIGKLLGWSFQNAYDVPKEIIKAAGIQNANVKLGIPGMGTAKQIIRDYYLGR